MQAVAAGTWTGLPGLYSWGLNAVGQLGLGNTTNYSSPKQVGTLTTWKTATINGYDTALAIKTDGTLWGWGSNGYGELGLGNTTQYNSPKQVGTLTTWSKITMGLFHTVAIKTDGTLWSWGKGGSGQLGLGNVTYYSSPKQVGALTTWAAIAANNNMTYGIKTDGTLWSWGKNLYGELGLGTSGAGTYKSSPNQVGALTTWLKIAGGSYCALAIKTDGTLWSWGYNSKGQLGQGNITNRSSPVQVGALTTWSNICIADESATTTKTDGTLWSWGWNNNGQLGLGNITNYSSPKQVGALTTWLKITAGYKGTLAIKTNIDAQLEKGIEYLISK
jgi:alpha-tubulin suppressor-like RCC1 family protein